MGRNVTLKLDDELLKKAKLLAAERDSSVSRMLSDYLGDMVSKASSYSDARHNALKLLNEGFELGFTGTGRRDELHR